MNYNPPSFSVRGILQAIILEWVAIPFSRESSWPRGRIWVSSIVSRFFTIWGTREAPNSSCWENFRILAFFHYSQNPFRHQENKVTWPMSLRKFGVKIGWQLVIPMFLRKCIYIASEISLTVHWHSSQILSGWNVLVRTPTARDVTVHLIRDKGCVSLINREESLLFTECWLSGPMNPPSNELPITSRIGRLT